MHMVIDHELFDLRNQYLIEAMKEVGLSIEMQELWLKIDEAFRNVLVKGLNEAKGRYKTDPILNFKKKGYVA